MLFRWRANPVELSEFWKLFNPIRVRVRFLNKCYRLATNGDFISSKLSTCGRNSQRNASRIGETAFFSDSADCVITEKRMQGVSGRVTVIYAFSNSAPTSCQDFKSIKEQIGAISTRSPKRKVFANLQVSSFSLDIWSSVGHFLICESYGT